MMDMQTRMQRGVTQIIAKLGAEFTLKTSVGDSVYDPDTGILTENVVTFTVRGVAVEYSQMTNGFGTNTGTQILTGDKRWYCDTSTSKVAGVASALIVDSATTEVNVGGKWWKTINIKEVNPTGNNVIAYEFQLRR